MSLAVAARDAGHFTAAIGQADDGLALAAQLPPGPERTRDEARLRADRGGALTDLGRWSQAAADYDRAREDFEAIGETADALRGATLALRARDAAGEPVGLEPIRQLVADLEAAVDSQERTDGGLMADLEYARLWLLHALAAEGTEDLEEVVGIIEALRDDRPVLRAGTDQPDPVVARLCRPFTVLGARLRRLHNTVLVVIDPGLQGESHRQPVFLVVSGGSDRDELRWSLVAADRAQEALSHLSLCANEERQRLLTGQNSLYASPSDALTSAAAEAWSASLHRSGKR